MNARSPRKPVIAKSAQAAAIAEAAAMAEAADLLGEAEEPEAVVGGGTIATAADSTAADATAAADAAIAEAAADSEKAAEAADEAESAEPQEAPRWAAPAVPPPPAPRPAAGKATSPRAAAASAAETAAPVPAPAPAVPRKPLLPQSWTNTLAVAAVIAAVVLGGFGLDGVLAAPSAGVVDLGAGVTMTAAPGWVQDDTDMDFGVRLQKGSVVLLAGAVRSTDDLSQVLEAEMDGLRSASAEVAFGTVQSGTIGGHEARTVFFTAILDWGTADGEIVCLSVAGRVVIVEAFAPQGYLQDGEADIETMIKSVEVGR